MTSLNNKVAIITGASSGIGRATALLFARKGAKLILNARNDMELQRVSDQINQIGGSALTVAGSVADESVASALVEKALSEFGGLDIAFNNAGTLGVLKPITGMTSSEWKETLDVNLSAAFFAAKHQLPAMLDRGAGSLIFTGTFVGYSAGMPGMGAYAASKSALIGLTQTLAVEYGSMGIRVNALLPGGTDTPMGRSVANTPEALDYVAGLHALKRIASPEEIANAALFLASDASSFVTGSAMLVDGGVSIARS